MPSSCSRTCPRARSCAPPSTRTAARSRRSRASPPTGCSRASRRSSSEPSCSWHGGRRRPAQSPSVVATTQRPPNTAANRPRRSAAVHQSRGRSVQAKGHHHVHRTPATHPPDHPARWSRSCSSGPSACPRRAARSAQGLKEFKNSIAGGHDDDPQIAARRRRHPRGRVAAISDARDASATRAPTEPQPGSWQLPLDRSATKLVCRSSTISGELRTRLVVSLAALVVAFGFAFWQNHALLNVLNRPLERATAGALGHSRGPLAQTARVQQSLSVALDRQRARVRAARPVLGSARPPPAPGAERGRPADAAVVASPLPSPKAASR